MTKVKICGITNLEDALIAVRCGADAIGFNFYEKSPRFIAANDAAEIIRVLPDDVSKVGVFVNHSCDSINDIVKNTGIDTIQLHGDETDEIAAEIKVETGKPLIKVFKASNEVFASGRIENYIDDSILLDADSAGLYGGTGEVADWKIAGRAARLHPKLYLAGGLNAGNVSAAIRQVRPYAVDACSGIESEKGKKDPGKLKEFIEAVRNTK